MRLIGALVLLASCASEHAPTPEPRPVTIEYIAHACFRLRSPDGTRLLIDPYASRVWLGYDFPDVEADAVLVTHPHYDHDAGARMGKPWPWGPGVRVLRDPGRYEVGDVAITGIKGKHADPYGKEFGQKNTIWLFETGGLRIVHLGDNGPLTEENVAALGRVDVLMAAIDGNYHILKADEIQAIRAALRPRVLVPMHYRIPDLEPDPEGPHGLGDIDPWLAGRSGVVRLDANVREFEAGALPESDSVFVFPHSPQVRRPR